MSLKKLKMITQETAIEIWKDIRGFKGLYQISNSGKVKSLKRRVKLRNTTRNVPEKILKYGINKDKYLTVSLYKKNKRKMCRINRLVALHFIPNPNNLPEVNHEDSNKLNNWDWNLKWMTSSQNQIHAYQNNKGGPKTIPIIKYTLTGKKLEEYPSTNKAATINNISQGNIWLCINNKRKSIGGFIWKKK